MLDRYTLQNKLKELLGIASNDRVVRTKKKNVFTDEIQVPGWITTIFIFIYVVLVFAYPSENGIIDWKTNLVTISGFSLFTILCIVFLGLYLKYYVPKILPKGNNLILLCLVGLLVIISAKMLILHNLTGYLVPMAIASMMIAILLDPALSIVMTVVLSMFAGVIYRCDFGVFFVCLSGGLAGTYGATCVSHRTDLIKAGFMVSAINVFTIIIFVLLKQNLVLNTFKQNILWGILNGFICAILTLGLLPYLENMFRITTDIKLLEIGDFNQSLLKKLMLEAPGTYHHSLIIGNLAEAAASSVGANPLMARVGGYYHDVGKLTKPQYFVENQVNISNKHDDLTSQMSNLILISHVKDGVVLAREAKIPDPIINIIEQHHGTDITFFFYQQALKDQGPSNVEKEQYRYPGPKPQTKEAAIIMLADSVEAASRTLDEPTYGHMQDLVTRIINNKFIDGQLDECDLTLKDLHLISENFLNVLTALFHTRIEYPNPEKG